MKGVGKIFQQTFIDTYSRVAHVKLYTEKSAITSADILNDKVLPFYASQSIEIQRIRNRPVNPLLFLDSF